MSELTKIDKQFNFLFRLTEDADRPPIKAVELSVPPPPVKPIPTEIMRKYDCLLTDGECQLDEEYLAVNGWLDPNGALYACAWQQHAKTLSVLGFDTERDAIERGFIKLSQMHWQLEQRYCPVNPTDHQLSTIHKWHYKNALSLSYFESQLNKRKG